MSSSTPGEKLLKVIKKALDDHELTMTEYQEILAQAGEDGVIDSEEQRLLGQLHEMIANGAVKRTPG
jgi:hypothetical protein